MESCSEIPSLHTLSPPNFTMWSVRNSCTSSTLYPPLRHCDPILHGPVASSPLAHLPLTQAYGYERGCISSLLVCIRHRFVFPHLSSKFRCCSIFFHSVLLVGTGSSCNCDISCAPPTLKFLLDKRSFGPK